MLSVDPDRPHEPPPSDSPFPRRKHVELWRAHNRRRWELERDTVAPDEPTPFVCECTSATCLSAVPLTMAEYEAAHPGPSFCAVIAGHVIEDDGARVHRKHPHHWVVELRPLARSPAEPAVA